MSVVFTVEKYCTDVARHSSIHTSDAKNISSRALSVENSHDVHDDEQVSFNTLTVALFRPDAIC